MKKLVSVVVPIYNEVDMVNEIHDRIAAVFRGCPDYAYEIVFFDDGSTDGTRVALEQLCSEHNDTKCVFYSRNYGYLKSTFYCFQQAAGDCAIIVHADLQNPPELIPQFLEKWEQGAQVVQGIKTKSRENRLMFFLRSVFYFLMIQLFGVNIKAHATEFELLDKTFIAILKKIKVSNPFLRGIISEYASSIDYVYYVQDQRKKGKSKFNLSRYYDFAMCGITQFSRKIPRCAIAFSSVALVAVIIEFLVCFLPAAADSPSIPDSILLRCLFVALCLTIIYISILFEYVIAAIDNTADKPLIVEEKRINC